MAFYCPVCCIYQHTPCKCAENGVEQVEVPDLLPDWSNFNEILQHLDVTHIEVTRKEVTREFETLRVHWRFGTPPMHSEHVAFYVYDPQSDRLWRIFYHDCGMTLSPDRCFSEIDLPDPVWEAIHDGRLTLEDALAVVEILAP